MSIALALNALGLPAKEQSVLAPKKDTCPPGCAPLAAVHGDPMFKINGTGTHFWLKDGDLTPLLTVGSVVLSGKTFSRPDTGHQWFDELVVANKGKAVLNVAIVNRTAQVKLGGKVVSSGKLNANGVEAEFVKNGISARAGGIAITIYTSQATKFASGPDRAKYEHLNMNFDGGVPTDAKGIFAELAGVQEMSEATTSLLKQPKAMPKAIALYQAGRCICSTFDYNSSVGSVAIVAGSGQNGTADGDGSAAEFDEPKGLEISPDGTYLYVAEWLNQRIRRIVLATGTVSTIAGSITGFTNGIGASAAFNNPAGLGMYPDGETLLVGDVKNNAVRSIDLSTNTVTTLAGGTQGYADGSLDTAQFDSPADVVVSPDAAKVYVADGENNRIRVIDLVARTVSTLAGSGDAGSADAAGAGASFAFPFGLDLTQDGATLFVADFLNNRIRSVDTGSGVVSTLAGSGPTKSWACAAIDFTTCGSFADGAGDAAAFAWPASGTLTPDEKYFIVADFFNQRVRAVSVATREVTTLALLDASDTSSKYGVAGPADVVSSPDGGTLYVSQRKGQRIAAITVPKR